MSQKPYEVAVFIGRFQPYHIGHHHVALEALKQAERLFFIIGSHNTSLTIKDPFTSQQRRSLIENCFDYSTQQRISYICQADHLYNEDRWIHSIQSNVYNVLHNKANVSDDVKIALVGYSKDHSSYYLKKFPQWDYIQINPKHQISATDIRECLFNNKPFGEMTNDHEHYDNIRKYFSYNDSTYDLKNEYKVINDYRKSWASSPYPPTFVTVDAIVVQSGHILLVRRRSAPGKGLWALPGGFVNQTETTEEAVLRELEEETKIKIPKAVLKGSIVKQHLYDAPDRSLRGRTITHGFLIKLNDMEALPKIKGSDDADKAKWVSFADFTKMRQQMFEDHFDIISHMVGI